MNFPSFDEHCKAYQVAHPPKPVVKKKFSVCKCEPPPEMCMCDGCHTCKGKKREYADKYRNDPYYEEV